MQNGLEGCFHHSRSLKTANFLALLLFILVLPLTGFRSQRQDGLCRQVAGKMIYASPGDNLSTKANSLSPGDRLILPDSLYANSQLHMDGIHGTPTAPIT